ncbi:MAG: hypothetical protein JNM84_27295 [Planctomycetes bacterium]|nr:hypothetical protein [Planctomycetota bacterium]
MRHRSFGLPHPMSLVALMAVALAPACGDRSNSASHELIPLLREIAEAQIGTSYQAVRRRMQRDPDADATTTIVVERVFHRAPSPADANERHLVELVELQSGSQPRVWEDERFKQLSLTHRLRSNFIERYRELRIGRPEQVLANYDVSVHGDAQVLGRDVLRLEIASKHRREESGLGRGIYELWVDASTKLPLRTREYSLETGERLLIAESELTSLETLADDSVIEWPKLDFEREPLGDAELPAFLAGRKVGFPPVVPGFEKQRRETLREPGAGEFVLHLCSDGIEPLLFLQGLPENPARMEARGEGESRELRELEILEVEFGRSIALTTTYDGVSIYVIGKGDSRALREIFEQFFHF